MFRPRRRSSEKHRLLWMWEGLEAPYEHDQAGVPISALVEELIDELQLGEALTEQALGEAWGGLVGDFLALHSRPDSLRHGVVTVRVSQPTVHQELSGMKRRLVKALQGRFGEGKIRDVRFRIG
jgi:predicted nucleic acid-binding Zn ribbon protein